MLAEVPPRRSTIGWTTTSQPAIQLPMATMAVSPSSIPPEPGMFWRSTVPRPAMIAVEESRASATAAGDS